MTTATAATILGETDEDDAEALIKGVTRGLPFSSFGAIAAAFGLSQSVLAEAIAVPARTLARRKREGALGPAESDRLARVARVLAHAVRVFEDEETAGRWLKSEVWALGGATPLSFLNTDPGAEIVNSLLGRISHSVYG